jgi:ABC-type Na+ efflux pump permease subunit
MLGDDGKRRVSRWFVASFFLLVLAAVAIFLLWRAGPFAPRFTPPEVEATRWHLPDWVWLLSFAVSVLATPLAVIGAAIGLAKLKPGVKRWPIVLGLLLVFLVILLLVRF